MSSQPNFKRSALAQATLAALAMMRSVPVLAQSTHLRTGRSRPILATYDSSDGVLGSPRPRIADPYN